MDNGIILVLCFCIHMFIGLVVNTAIKEDWQEYDVICMIFWPIVLVALLMILFMRLAVFIGEKLRELFTNTF